jgi:phosphodiesterase/alkaline phosphatase D-like protein
MVSAHSEQAEQIPQHNLSTHLNRQPSSEQQPMLGQGQVNFLVRQQRAVQVNWGIMAQLQPQNTFKSLPGPKTMLFCKINKTLTK